jgi:hypothetical protein
MGTTTSPTRAARRILLHRRFHVDAAAPVAWARLADVASWPSWAHHIRRVDLDPPEALTANSRGSVRLTNGIRSEFVVTTLDDGRRWEWFGRFLWLGIRYDHVVEPDPAGGALVTFDVEATGFAVGTIGRIFKWVYARNLDRAIPLLVEILRVR